MGGVGAGFQVAARWRDTCAMKNLSITYEYGMKMYISGGFFPPEGKILSPLSQTGGGILSPLSQTVPNLRPLPPVDAPGRHDTTDTTDFARANLSRACYGLVVYVADLL